MCCTAPILLLAILSAPVDCHKKVTKQHKTPEQPSTQLLTVADHKPIAEDGSSVSASSYTWYSRHTLFDDQPNYPAHLLPFLTSRYQLNGNANHQLLPWSAQAIIGGGGWNQFDQLAPSIHGSVSGNYNNPNVLPPIMTQANPGVWWPAGNSNRPVNPYLFLPSLPPPAYYRTLNKQKQHHRKMAKKRASVLKRVLTSPHVLVLLGGVGAAFLFPTLVREEVQRSLAEAARAQTGQAPPVNDHDAVLNLVKPMPTESAVMVKRDNNNNNSDASSYLRQYQAITEQADITPHGGTSTQNGSTAVQDISNKTKLTFNISNTPR